nr:hypothetical protein [Tanacetum cinerariifolium]
MLKQEFLEFRIGEAEGLHKGGIAQRVALTLKTKGRLELLSFDDLYYKLKTLEVDVKGYTTFSSSQSTGPSHSAFVSATSASIKMSYGDSLNYSSTTTYSVPSNSKTGSHRSDFEQIEKLDLEEMDLKWKMAMLSVRVHKFEQKDRRKIDFDKKESARFNNKKTDHDGETDGFIASKEFGMIAGYDTEDAIEEGAVKIYNLITGADTEEASTAGDAKEFALMGVTSEKVLQRNQLTLKDKIRVLSIELENTSNLLKHNQRINADVETAKKDLQTKLDNHLVQAKKWRNSSKNLSRLIDSSMSVRTKVGLGFNNCIRENELGWDDSAFSVFTTNSEDVEGRPLFYSDKSSEVNTNDFASSDSSVKSSEPKLNDSTSYALTSSVSTSENKAKIESNVGIPIQELLVIRMVILIKRQDCDFYEKQMVNKTVGIRVGLVHSRNKVNHLNQFVPQAILLRTVKVTIPPARPQPVPTGKPKVFALVPTGRQNRPFPVPTDRGYSPSISSDWWKSTARPMSHFNRPTSSYFQTYTPYVPTMSYTHMIYGEERDAEVEGIFNSGCSRSMTGNKERLDDFQEFQGGKVTFGGGEGRITGKGTI